MKRLLSRRSLGLTVPAFFLAAAAEADAPPRPATTGKDEKPPYWGEPRLAQEIQFAAAPADDPFAVPDLRLITEFRAARPVDLPAVYPVGIRVLTGKEVVDRITKITGVRVMLQGNWLAAHVALPRFAGPARELMDDLAHAFPLSRWLLEGTTWILAQGQHEAQLTLLSDEERHAQVMQIWRMLFTTMSVVQWNQLGDTGRLELAQLTVPQRRAVGDMIRLDYYDQSGDWTSTPRPEALEGKNVHLEFSGQGKSAELDIVAPAIVPIGYRPGCLFYKPSGELTFGILPPR
jgi:hypothetical protein